VYLIKHLSSGSFQLSLSEPQVFVQRLPEPELLEPAEFAEACKNTLPFARLGSGNPHPHPQSRKIHLRTMKSRFQTLVNYRKLEFNFTQICAHLATNTQINLSVTSEDDTNMELPSLH
jgi:hypothetical protein